MTDQQILTTLLPNINRIKNDEIKKCNMPFEIYIYEAERLLFRSTEDIEQLKKINMPECLLPNLDQYIRALRQAQLNWVEGRTNKIKAQKEWNAAKPAILQLRKELLNCLSFAFRNRKELLEKLNKVKKSTNHAEKIMDLKFMAQLCKKHQRLLKAINFDFSLPEQAWKESERMSNLIAKIESHLYIKDEILLVRDKSYTIVKKYVDEIRSYGQFAFHKDPEKKKAYSSERVRNLNMKRYKARKEAIASQTKPDTQ